MWTLRELSLLLPLTILAACGGSGGGERREVGVNPPPPPSSAPITPADDTYTGVEENSAGKVLDVLANDGDNVDGATVQCVSRSRSGAEISLTQDGRDIVFSPALGFTGTDEFRYRAVDTAGNSGSATVEVRVEASRRADDAPPATPAQTNQEIRSPYLTELYDYATPSVISPGPFYRFRQKPLHADELPPFSNAPGKEHIHRLPLKRSQIYDIHVSFNDDGSFPNTSHHPTIALIDANADQVVNVVTTFDFHSGIENYRPARTETQYLSIFSDKYADVPAYPGEGDERAYYVWVEVVDDNAGTTDTAAVAGGRYPVRGRLEVASDQDWFRVTLAGGEPHRITLDTYGTSAPMNVSVRRADAPGVSLASGASQSGDSSVSLTVLDGNPGEFNDYFIAIGGSGVGDYEITTAGGDVPSDVETYGRIELEAPPLETYLARFPDTDWFATHLEAGASYLAEASTYPDRSDWLRNPGVAVFDESGTVLFDKAAEAGANCLGDPDCLVRASLRFAAPYSGTYFISASRAGRSGGGLERLALMRLGTGEASDYAADLSTIARMETTALMTGTLDSAGDVDWLRQLLLRGEPVVVHGSSADIGDLELVLMDTDGVTELASSTPNSDGSVTLRFRGVTRYDMGALVVRSPSGATGGYELRREGGDPPDRLANNPLIGFNGSVLGEVFSRQDEDIYRVSLEADRSYLFELTPDVNAPTSAQDYPYLELLDGSTGNFGALTAIAGDISTINYTAGETRTYYLRVSNERRSGGARGGAYRLQARNTSDAELCEEF